MENKKITTNSVYEMICSLCIIGTMFMPWMDITFMGETISNSMIDADKTPPIVYIISTLCIVNFFVKFFNRSLWLSLITAAFPLGYVIEMANQLHEIRSRMGSDFTMGHVSLGGGAIVAALLTVSILISVFISWIIYMQEKASNSPREKFKRYFVFAGIGLSIPIVDFFFFFHYLTEVINNEDISNSTMGILALASLTAGILGVLIFIQYLLMAFMTLAYNKKGKKNQHTIISTDVQTVHNTEISEAPESKIEEETQEKPNRTLLYSIGGVIAVAIIGIICFFAFGKSKKSESLLGLQKPKWEKFVHMKGKETAFFQTPDISSPRLMQACNDEGCGIDYQYLWTGDKPSTGYKDLQNFKYEDATSVFPVVEEQDGWYKVQITGLGDVREAYVEKSQCEEVKPEPITQEVLSSISSDYNLQEKGKNKNLCFALNTEEEIARLRVGELLDGNCLAFPFAYEATTEESDTTATSYFEVSDYTSDDGTKSYSFSIYYNPSRIVAKDDYKTFDTKSLTEEEMTDIVTKVTSIKQKFDWITYEYYFPSVSTEHLFSFRVFDEPSDEETSSATEEKSVTDYKVENKKLLALVGNEWMETGFYTEDGNIEIYHQEDLDNDGNYEIILQIFEGNAYDNPFIVYYDKASSTFKRTKSMELEENPSLETRYDPHTLMIQKEGLRTIKYVFAEGKLKIESDNMENVGRIRSTLKVADIYSGSEEGERNMTFDFDGDGEEENITFHRSMTHAEDYGKRINIVMVKWADGREICSESNSLLRAGTFKFLVSETNGMPDVICDNYLMKWNGSNYETAE